MAIGEKNGKAKLTEENVRQIVHLQKEGFTYRKIEEIVGVSYQQVGRILLKKSWKHLTRPDRTIHVQGRRNRGRFAELIP